MIATARMFRATAVPGRPRPPWERAARPSPGVPRRRVTPNELVAALNRRLAALGGGDGLRVDAGTSLRRPHPDGDGCNWSPCALRVHLAHGPAVRNLATVRRVVEWGRLNLELAEPGA